MERDKTEAERQGASEEVERANEESRREGEVPVQVASQGLIILDVGVLMGSRSPQVMDEMIAIYPGAQLLMDIIRMTDCTCEDPMCRYDVFQGMIENVAGEDNEAAAKFLETLDAKKAEITKPEELKEFFQEYRHNVHKGSWTVIDMLRDTYPTSFN